MTVAELIAQLQTQQQDLQVVFPRFSEFCIIPEDGIRVEDHALPRPDGWVHYARPGKPTQRYLVLGDL